jgi:cytochrome c-type biogenesis protein CcmH
MNGWIILIVFAIMAFAALVKLGRLSNIVYQPLAAALILGCAGYAYQGNPFAVGASAQSLKTENKAADAVIAMRADMDQNFSVARPYLILSDSFSRDGKYTLAANYISAGIRRYPENADLWAGLAVQLVLANDGKMSPPALFAFGRVRKLLPRHPAPDYFAGLDALFEGRPDEALAYWRKLLLDPPKSSKWVPKLESHVKGLGQMIQGVDTSVQNDK